MGQLHRQARVAITVSERSDQQLEARARLAARLAGVPLLSRPAHAPLRSLLAAESLTALIVFEAAGVSLLDDQASLRFSPGLAALRIKQLDAGRTGDPLQRVSGLAEGDRVLDCTLGLGADSLVAARLVGPTGSVVGLETSLPLYLLVRYGLPGLPAHPNAGLIEVLHADAALHLRSQRTKSFDVVLFDPMFARARRASFAFEVLRRHADHAGLTLEMVAEARRVARKAVVIKGSPHSTDFKKLNLTPERGRPGARVLWARLPAA